MDIKSAINQLLLTSLSFIWEFTWSASALATSESILALAALASALAWLDSLVLIGLNTLIPSCKESFYS